MLQSRTPLQSAFLLLLLASTALGRALQRQQNFSRISSPSNAQIPKYPQVSPKIIGGELVKVGEAPWQVALLRHNRFTCGGVWIDTKRVLTAAHCVDGFENSPQSFRIRYATLYRNGGAELAVSRIIRHPSYAPSTYDYDVAVLCTETPFIPGINAQIVAIASSPPVSGSRAVATGWGRVHASAGTQLPLFLQKASNLTVQSEEECQRHSPELQITSRMLCAFSQVQAICTGDSGGPLISTATGQLIGITSWASSWCLHPSHPGVFARLDTLRPWILATCAQADSIAGNSATVERLKPALSVISLTVVAFNPLLKLYDSLSSGRLTELWSYWW